MINLRYHIVSLTAVFLAIGIGLTLGSTFLDRATVENLNGQLDNLATSLRDREEQIGALNDQVDAADALHEALDEQALGLLAGRIEGVPAVVIGARGVDDAQVAGAVQALVVGGADVQGIWWLTDRFTLDDDGEIDDLALALDETSMDPSRLRRMAITQLGGELRARQLLGLEPDEGEADEAEPGEGGSDGDPAPPGTDQGAGGDDEAGAEVPTQGGGEVPSDPSPEPEIVTTLVDAGFLEFEAVAGGPELPTFPDGTRVLVVAGSTDVPDDLVLEPLVDRMARATDTPVAVVVGSAVRDGGGVSDLVAVIRQHEQLRELVPTVDSLEHFHGWAAVVLAFADLGEGSLGHYGLDDSASRLLPPVRT